ncbi:glycoside hydrolase family 31 protein [Testudinibacter sp. TR-2022]|uniref:glycoside hydrolase family 31 protein n=1 Tax=Testudinibacter sp. TR-2022 TaxID=2585029 RepID=UPI00111ADA4E|nr:glycoside hydrolase family 31 protein [Testudinibacter sp. TR-2022]TNH08473.1 glycoside hydrolase family 31 protein [Pasteurellaceae bacterium Phil11]TNH26043.1 glycoside hydrolase family 31 protein [Testudinibacter sp. TR-2022]TNH28292.1 glycoside hydrolase family 31 protein [Testudinibacter sp. TR-2022]
MKILKNWEFIHQENNRIDIQCDYSWKLHIFVLEQDIFRVAFSQDDHFRVPQTWAITPNQADIAWQGRDRWSLDDFSLPEYSVTKTENSLIVASEKLRVIVHQPLWLEWQYNNNGTWTTFVADRKTGAYLFGISNAQISHFLQRDVADQYYGLGEKAGNLNRHGRRFEMRNLDAMGYNAETTDPLYKHIPFYITHTEELSYGLYYDNLASCWFRLGSEIDNYHTYYRSYQAEDGDLDYYMILGPKILDVTKKYTALTGGTIFEPKWSLGYSGSTMHYTDAPDAQEQLKKFVDLCEQHAIPCDSFQLSSGYTSIGNKRYVFNWNYDKVPQPKEMSAYFHRAGMKLAANIKPCLLHDHPKYHEVAQAGLFIQDSESEKPEVSVFWDDEGSHLDFTNPNTIDWWKTNVKQQLLEYGIDSTWNDNNEFEVWDNHAKCHYFGKGLPIKLIRPLQPLLMMKASYEAQIEYAPNIRPYLISRSGSPGMNRYVQTWSGDNRTSWNTLRYNIKMGLGMSLSGLYNLGHDVGGFSGNKPDPELFVRWVQNGVMHPRFTIHSWNDDKTVNEPWMYPEITPIIREAIKLRYRLMPYLYNLLWKAHHEHEPMLRPTFLDHDWDNNTFKENDDYLLGQDLLVASVVEPGQTTRQVYLPDNQHGWYDFYSHQWFAGKQSIIVDAPLEKIPLFIKAGSILPLSGSRLKNTQHDNQRELLIMPFLDKGETTITLFDDDGVSFDYLNRQHFSLNLNMKCTDNNIELTINKHGDFIPEYTEIVLTLPSGESRKLTVNGIPANKINISDIKSS